MASKKVLITGKNSKLGKAFEWYISGSDIAVDSISLRDGSWKEADWSGYDAILHVAGITKTDTGTLSSEKESEYFSVNSDLTREVAQKAKNDRVSQFIYLSTMMVYGNAARIGSDRLITEDTIPVPECAYGRSKLAGESISELGSDDYKVLIVREPVIYGEHFDGEVDALYRIAQRVGLFPNINSCKSFIYEGNLCELLRLAIINELSGIICPQNREMITTSQLYCHMRNSYGKKCHLIKGLKGLLSLLSHVSAKIDVLFQSIRYSEELSCVDGIDYKIFSLEESLSRIDEYRKEHV